AELGVKVITMSAVSDKPIDQIRNIILRQIRPENDLYVSIDLDVFDPAFAPGVGNPEPFGLWPRKFLSITRLLSGFRIRAFDIMELNPFYDGSQITAMLCGKIIKELLSIIPSSSGTPL
ncbi:MAG: arginase family protein, partial [Candidatus Ranarchaeia archaeon]